ncbi:MAG: hypothetical protein MJ245_01300 [Clostridia bacterium]|nr:hypothetical protein [Clostridia bacterium]
MNRFTKIGEGEYLTNSLKQLKPIIVPEQYTLDSAQFAYDMTYGKKGAHRENNRAMDTIFANAYQGKLAEFAIYDYLNSYGVDCSKPDIRALGRGYWDSGDLYSGNEIISVKSSVSYMNFLRLKFDDYDEQGRYRYGYGKYKEDDYIAYARVLPNINRTIKDNSFEISDLIRRDALTVNDLERLVAEETWKCDLTGFITRDEFRKEIIEEDLVVEKGDKVDNLTMFDKYYYAQAGDLSDMDDLLCELSGLSIDELEQIENELEDFHDDDLEL